MKKYLIFAAVGAAALLAGCGLFGGQVMDGDGMVNSHYEQISQDEAKEMMSEDDGHIIVDVRRQDEFAEGHIPEAICIPNEEINDSMPAELPDTEQVILVYCRSGREAAQKLADMGYSRVYEFGGIIDWTGEVVTEAASVTQTGAVTTTESPKTEPEQWDMTPTAIICCEINGNMYNVSFEDNEAANALLSEMSKGPLTLEMSDYGGFEKVVELPFTLPANDEMITTRPGQITLYQGNKLSIYYAENTWELTEIGYIDMTEEELAELKDAETVTVELWAEWTE